MVAHLEKCENFYWQFCNLHLIKIVVRLMLLSALLSLRYKEIGSWSRKLVYHKCVIQKA